MKTEAGVSWCVIEMKCREQSVALIEFRNCEKGHYNASISK